MDPVEKIGWLLRWQRKRRKITVKALAEQAQINPSTVNRLERGQGAGLDAVLRVARVLELEDRIVAAFGADTDSDQGRGRQVQA